MARSGVDWTKKIERNVFAPSIAISKYDLPILTRTHTHTGKTVGDISPERAASQALWPQARVGAMCLKFDSAARPCSLMWARGYIALCMQTFTQRWRHLWASQANSECRLRLVGWRHQVRPNAYRVGAGGGGGEGARAATPGAQTIRQRARVGPILFYALGSHAVGRLFSPLHSTFGSTRDQTPEQQQQQQQQQPPPTKCHCFGAPTWPKWAGRPAANCTA